MVPFLPREGFDRTGCSELFRAQPHNVVLILERGFETGSALTEAFRLTVGSVVVQAAGEGPRSTGLAGHSSQG